MESITALTIALDIGGFGTKACSMISSPGSPIVNDSISFVHFNRNEIETPMIVTYLDGRLIEGREVEDRLRAEDNSIDEVQCMRFLKLALQPDEKTKVLANRVIECAKRFGKTPADVMKDYIPLLVDKIKMIIASDITADDVERMPLHLIISVPQLWIAQTCRILTDAARPVSQKCSIVQEPFCATAQYVMDEIKKPSLSMRIKFKARDALAVIGAGAATSDMEVFELCDEPASPNFKIKAIAPARACRAAGSAVNQRCEFWIRNEYFCTPMALEQAAHSIGISGEELVLRLLTEFELEKRDFGTTNKKYYSISVHCRPGAGVRRKVEIDLTSEQMQSFFDPVVDELGEEIRNMLKGVRRLKAIALCGGFGRNCYVMDRVEAMFPGVQLLHPNYSLSYKSAISRGALLRYTIPFEEWATWSLLMERDEEFDGSLHPDAVHNPNLVKTSWLDKDIDVVQNRVHYIYDGHRGTTRPFWRTLYIPFKGWNQPISFVSRFYWTEKPDLVEHEPLMEVDGRTVRDCYQVFEEIEHVIEHPGARGCRKVRNPRCRRKGQPRDLWEVHIGHVTRLNALGIQVCTFVQDPAQGLFNGDTPDESWVPIVDESTHDFEDIYEKNYSQLPMEVDRRTAAPNQSRP